MLKRSHCRCTCHSNPGVIHFMPCCYPDHVVDREMAKHLPKTKEPAVSDRMLLAFMMGPTHVGKSTAIRDLLARGERVRSLEHGLPVFGSVEVGKLMRAKYLDPASPHYTPDKFRGQAAPRETQVEAWQMLLDGIARCREEGCNIVLIDGQPRDYQQARDALALPDEKVFVNLFAPIDERRRRFEASERAKNPEDRSLSERRMAGDLTMLYEVLGILHCHEEENGDPADIRFYDTTRGEYDPVDIYHDLCEGYEFLYNSPFEDGTRRLRPVQDVMQGPMG